MIDILRTGTHVSTPIVQHKEQHRRSYRQHTRHKGIVRGESFIPTITAIHSHEWFGMTRKFHCFALGPS